MRTREQELEFQVIDIFKEFYKERMVNENVASFIVEEHDLDGMLSIEAIEKDNGKFYHTDLDDDIFYKFVKKREKLILIFIRLENFSTVGYSS
ncbi:MAG: hypothetical protein ACRC4T_20985 [Cetobacterium sp.]